MKLYWVSFLLFFYCSLNVCAYSSVIYQEKVPRKIQVFLDKHFSKYEIEKLKYEAKGGDCKVKYTNGIKVKFDHNGDWEEVESDYTPLPKSIIDILPHPAIDFIARNYPRRPILKIKRKSDRYEVELDRSLDIEFDNRGNILKVDN
ncbi:hypothetical protein M2451_004002 [Dysgonomonas sp. PFB1-18]|uniref:PepSY-like domain-containing protein n=1 Tax=unclassified Dysgonomonas TaxID=2630389 RepID=UPI002474CF89|nr:MULTISPECIES: PepSY-like domain-containing protein [unclassified Dysgonomonas]MDH6311129.1 hypothetical protein [Dysgonomonas sp. PF1-14]MDH6341017.1 hypothetical protein [Dysgonomonas sp. PF1-16]MDH6382657.1 hypothetical protein [Dysgonomonas sp. PFB1-18]MDH6399994.1 hypothetical protein [Dysgonomonas sp. PF1-23]